MSHEIYCLFDLIFDMAPHMCQHLSCLKSRLTCKGEIREKLSAKTLRRTQGFGKYEKLRHLVDGKLSFCSSLLQIRDENFSPGISLPSYFTTSHVCPKLGRSFFFKKIFYASERNVKTFPSSWDKNVKKVPWLTKSWMEPEQAPTSCKYLFFNHIRFGMKNWKLSLRDFFEKFCLSSLVFAEKEKNFFLSWEIFQDTTVKFTIIEIRFPLKFLLLLLCWASIVCSSQIESGSQIAYAAK